MAIHLSFVAEGLLGLRFKNSVALFATQWFSEGDIGI